ncbi:hypothetical protein BDR04DRAFT_894889 [Suillus decipiens]|nr:hypothetical protein BDR04DRAFT_894889 [Suillus decipiens]
MAHLSFLDESHFEKLDGLLFISCTGRPRIPTCVASTCRRIMVDRKCTYHFQVFLGVKHGFDGRCNPAIETQREWPGLIIYRNVRTVLDGYRYRLGKGGER